MESHDGARRMCGAARRCVSRRDTTAHGECADLVCQRYVLTGRSHSSLRGVETSSRPGANEASSPRARRAQLKVAQKVSRTRPQRDTETAAATPGPAACGEALQREADGCLREPSGGESGPCSVGRGALQCVAALHRCLTQRTPWTEPGRSLRPAWDSFALNALTVPWAATPRTWLSQSARSRERRPRD